MRVLVHVCAMDEERGVKATREEVVDVPGKVIKLYEVLGGDEDAVLRQIGDTVMAAAMRELQAGRVDLGQALVDAGGGRIGGRGGAVQPVVEAASATRAAPAPAGADKLSSMLGLDLIKHQVSKERSQPQQQGPGSVGFPRR